MFSTPKPKPNPHDSAKESGTKQSEPRPRPRMQRANTIPTVKQNQVTTGLRPVVYEIRTRAVDHSARTNWEEDKPDRSITALCQNRGWDYPCAYRISSLEWGSKKDKRRKRKKRKRNTPN
ncbi:hypothetical protein BJ508DRAFT_378531 [Ascobolus immersus RN42]|uniref:Uncharacterized protein n=1 Tax=Ascobolus immersus RN42 TaxID=1160509 RepID=A0A3N4HY45_ASCIM|nr:hypothetical protein BJ508DRAFT_378531 [Ascobolus immersus RN42]